MVSLQVEEPLGVVTKLRNSAAEVLQRRLNFIVDIAPTHEPAAGLQHVSVAVLNRIPIHFAISPRVDTVEDVSGNLLHVALTFPRGDAKDGAASGRVELALVTFASERVG